jgi:hypothetical protein
MEVRHANVPGDSAEGLLSWSSSLRRISKVPVVVSRLSEWCGHVTGSRAQALSPVIEHHMMTAWTVHGNTRDIDDPLTGNSNYGNVKGDENLEFTVFKVECKWFSIVSCRI